MVVLPVGLFRGVGANGQLRIGSLRASGVSATDIDIGVESSDQGMTVKPLNAALYGGALEGEMRFTENDGVARLEIKQSMDRVQVGSLLADTGVTDRISGTGRLDLDIVATETAGEPRTRGMARFHFFDGAIKGFDLRKIYLQARRIYNDRKGREEEVGTDDQEEFRFTEMKGTLDFDEKLASNDDLEVKSPLFRINGRGQADLSANRLDYLLLATVVESSKGQGGEELAELKGVTLPIRISGSLDAPSYTLDVAEILKLALRRRVEKEVEKKVQEKLGDELQQKLGDELQKLLKIN
jgi:AsmA protein